MSKLIPLLPTTNLNDKQKTTLRNYFKQYFGIAYVGKTVDQLTRALAEAAGVRPQNLFRYLAEEYNSTVIVPSNEPILRMQMQAAAAAELERQRKEAEKQRKSAEKKEAAKKKRKERYHQGKLPKPVKDENSRWKNYKKEWEYNPVNKYITSLQIPIPNCVQELVGFDDDRVGGSGKATYRTFITTDWMDVYKYRVLPQLKKLEKKFGKSAFFQIDLDGFYGKSPERSGVDENGNVWELEDTRVSIKAYQLQHKTLLEDEWRKELGSSGITFYLEQFTIKLIVPLKGGCWTCKGHGKMMKIDGLTLFSPYSTNNNCLFRLIENDDKMTKNRCNEIRQEFGIAPNEMIDLETANKICEKYSSRSVCFISNTISESDKKSKKYKFVNLVTLKGSPESELKFLLHDNHYMRVDGQNNYCKGCGKIYINTHNCNPTNVSYFQQKVMKAVIGRVNRKFQENKNKNILHYDIETQRKNENKQHKPYIVGFAYYNAADEVEYRTFSGRDCMVRFYDFLGSEEVSHITHVNAFNGSGFDHYYLFREKLERDGENKIGKFILNNGALMSAEIQGKKLIDLGRHLTGTLENNLLDLGCEVAKGSIDHDLSEEWEVTDDDRKMKVEEYLKCDVMGLMELYEKANSVIYGRYNMNICDSITTSACAFAIWKDKFLDEKHTIHLLNHEWEKNVRQSVYGGRVYKNKNIFVSEQYDKIVKGETKLEEIDDYIFDADVNSLYPTAMHKFEYPIGKEIVTNVYREGKLGVYKINYKCPKNILTAILPRKEEKKLIWDLHDSTGWYTSVDIENAKAHGYQIEVITGVYWEKSARVFQSYIEDFYKMKAAAAKGTAAYVTAKLYMNGLYGKMIQRPIIAKDSIVSTSEEFWSILNTDSILEMRDVGRRWMVKHVSKKELENPTGSQKPTQLGAFILSYSRKIMTEYYDMLSEDSNSLFYYCDTDSINIRSSSLPKIQHTINSELGGMSDDVGGKVIKAIYIAPKMYAFQYVISKQSYDKKAAAAIARGKNPPNAEKLSDDVYMMYHFRGKGVSSNKLTWQAFEDMHQGMEKIFYRDFQIKKIHTKRNSKQKSNDFFSHQHVDAEDTAKSVNRTKWEGRYFPTDSEGRRANISFPYGYFNPNDKTFMNSIA